MHILLFELAINPGRKFVRQGAARALLDGYAIISGEIVEQIAPQLLMTKIEDVASRLLLIFAFRAEISDITKAAEKLYKNEKRRVLLLNVIPVLINRDRQAAERISRMLPINHSGLMWALAGAGGDIDRAILDDPGEEASVEQAL